MPENFNNDPFFNTVSGVENVTKAKKKGKGKKVALISGVSVAAVVGGGAALYHFSPLVRNQIKLRTMKPDKYYAWVYEENSQDLAKSISDEYRIALDQYGNGTSSTVSLKYTASDDVRDFALDSLYEDFSGSDEKFDALEDMINNFDSVELGMHAADKKSQMNGSVFAKYNGSQLISAEYAADIEAQEYFVRIPELTEEWIGICLADLVDEELDDEEREIYETALDMLKDPGSYLTPEELEDMIVRYVGIWTDSVEGVKLKQDEKVKVAGLSVEYTAVTVKLTNKDILEIIRKYLEEVQDDDVIRGILIDDLGLDSDLYDDFFDEAIDDIAESIDDLDDDDDEELKFTTYIDAKGVIRGIDLKIYSGGEEEGEFFAALGKDGDKVRGEITLYEEGEALFTVEMKATEGKKETYSGSIEITAEDETVTIDFDDYNVVDEEKGYFNCDLKLDFTELTDEIEPINLSFDSDGSSQEISLYIDFIDDTDYGTVTLSYSMDKNADIDIPDSDDAYMIDYNDPSFGFIEYVTEQEVSAFVWNILVNIGLSEDLADEIADGAAEELFSEIDYMAE